MADIPLHTIHRSRGEFDSSEDEDRLNFHRRLASAFASVELGGL
jgi:hypothetical protein